MATGIKAAQVQGEDEVLDEKPLNAQELMEGIAQLVQNGRAKLRPSSQMQNKPKATGSRYADFEIFLCKPVISKIPIANTNQIRTVVTSIEVMDKVRTVKIEPHLVYGKYESPYTKGYNDQFLLGSDGTGLIQIYFPVKLDEKGNKIEGFGAKSGSKFGATTLEIFVKLLERGQILVQKREFNLFEYEGSRSLKEQVVEIKRVWEHKFANNDLIS